MLFFKDVFKIDLKVGLLNLYNLFESVCGHLDWIIPWSVIEYWNLNLTFVKSHEVENWNIPKSLICRVLRFCFIVQIVQQRYSIYSIG